MQIDSERLEDKVQRVIDDYLFGEDHKPLIKELYAREIKHTAIVKELREALEYYANNKHWYLYEGISDIVSYPVVREKGDVAKQALLRAEQLEGK